MPTLSSTIPIFKNPRNSDDFSNNLVLKVNYPEIAFKKIIWHIIDDIPHPSPNSKDKNLEYYYSLYGTAWIKVNSNDNHQYSKCVQCGKIFKRLRQLFTHISVHRNEQLYKCQYCSQKYFGPKSLRDHIIRKHSDRIDWPFYCPYCEKGYMLEHAFMRHMEAEALK